MAYSYHEAGNANERREAVIKKIMFAVAVAFAGFGIWSNSIGMMNAMKKSGLFVGFVLSLIYLKYPLKLGKASKELADDGEISPEEAGALSLRILDFICAILGAGVGLYTVFTTDRLAFSNLAATELDYIMAALALILVVEATRRSVGAIMACLPVIFALYVLFGNLIPGPLGHYGFTLKRFLMRMYLVDEGLYGLTTNTAASYIFLFILFGALLNECGVGELFANIANKIAGNSVGGPAKVGVISSGLMGTISGSAAANVATTGAFTIPMMKRYGFSPSFAGAVEAVASTGGLIMPPVMGAAAFLMSTYLGVEYAVIMKAAIIPALLYYFSCYTWVHFRAKSLNLKGKDRKDQAPLVGLRRRIWLFAPLIVITAALLYGYTAIYAAFLAMFSTVIAGLIQVPRLKVKQVIVGLANGALSSLSAMLACIAAGIIVGVMNMTGLGQVITYNIVQLSGGVLIVALVLTAVASLILSMGLPATACYIIVATVIAPALVEMGTLHLAAHMFVFYFACLSNITPPVAIAAYTAAGLAGAKPFSVAWDSIKIAVPAFLVPFLFVYNPVLLGQGATFMELAKPLCTAVIGVIFLSAAGAGYNLTRLPKMIRVLYFTGAVCLIDPATLTDIIGVLIVATGLFMEIMLHCKNDARRE